MYLPTVVVIGFFFFAKYFFLCILSRCKLSIFGEIVSHVGLFFFFFFFLNKVVVYSSPCVSLPWLWPFLDFSLCGPRQTKTCRRAYTDSEGPDQRRDQPALMRRLIRSLAVRDRIIGYYRMFQWKANAWLRLCACVGWCHYEKKPIQIYWKFYQQKWKFSD